MTWDEFNKAAELVAIQYITMNNIKTITDRIVERTRRELRKEVESAFREVDGWMRTMPADYSTKVIGDVEYSQIRDRIVALIVGYRLTNRVEEAITQFMKKVEDAK